MVSTQTFSGNGKRCCHQGWSCLICQVVSDKRKRRVSIKELLQFSLGPTAWSLPTPEGNVFKSVKSKLHDALEEMVSLVDCVPQNRAGVFDRMCIVQQMPSGLEIFGCVWDFILTRISNNPSSNIFFITNQWWDASIKSCDRNRRAISGSIRVTASRRDQKLPK